MPDEGDYETCSYCGRRLLAGVAQCPYCRNYTDGQGGAAESPWGGRLKRRWVIAGWLVVLAFVLPVLIALIQWALRR